MKKTMSRREFLRIAIGGSAIAGAGMVAQWLSGKARIIPVTGATSEANQYLPVVIKSGTTATPTKTATSTQTPTSTTSPTSTTNPPNNRVVHVWDPLATSWNFSTGWFRDNINQTRVNNMTNQGLMSLTNKGTITAAWQSILPGYLAGDGIAIKVNFNNASDDCNITSNQIDAVAEPVNALVSGMLQTGVQPADIWIFDATRPIPNHFRTRMVNQNVKILDSGACGTGAGFISTDTSAIVQFNHVPLTFRQLTDVLVDCRYLINMPILKDHGISAVSLGMKNHYGSIDCVLCRDGDYIHRMIDPDDGAYSSSYNPILEINKNVNIRNKTVLVVGDGLFGALGNTKAIPTRWETFNNASPNSLFFSRDPVAVECVMFDILNAEPVYHPKRGAHEDDYLVLAANSGMGSYERADPWMDTYTIIDYSRIEI
jgi:uncharacterized protein (DUF362 family)